MIFVDQFGTDGEWPDWGLAVACNLTASRSTTYFTHENAELFTRTRVVSFQLILLKSRYVDKFSIKRVELCFFIYRTFIKSAGQKLGRAFCVQ